MGDAPPTCAANDQTTTTTLLAILACSNVVLLFLVGLLMRRLERVHRKVSSLLKATYGAPRRRAVGRLHQRADLAVHALQASHE